MLWKILSGLITVIPSYNQSSPDSLFSRGFPVSNIWFQLKALEAQKISQYLRKNSFNLYRQKPFIVGTGVQKNVQ